MSASLTRSLSLSLPRQNYNPDILSMVPSLALQFPVLSYSFDAVTPYEFHLSGYHYFATNTTPVFNLNVSPDPAQPDRRRRGLQGRLVISEYDERDAGRRQGRL
jgi:hypothetical protein